MSGAHEQLEHAEHAAHSGHGDGHGEKGGHGGGNSKIFGLTMALTGVLIAFSAAMVGSERNELTRTMIEQTQAHSDYTGASTKFRIIMIELEKQRSLLAAGAKVEGGTLPVDRFVELAADYTDERSYSKAWADSYHPLISAHFDAAESYEHAQLIAEIGIVLASLAVLLASRSAWLVSVVLAAVCVLQLGRTYVATRHEVGGALEKVAQTEEAYQGLRKAHVGANEDEKTIDALDADGKVRAARLAHMKSQGAAEPAKEEKK